VKAIDTTLSAGDTVTLGTVEASNVKATRAGKLSLTAVHTGETDEHAVVTKRLSDGETVGAPDDAQVLAVTEGSGMAAPKAWLLVPTSAYGAGGDE
jgi:3-deoxy-D-manno-octulosonate 8-phosphate phosphatase KdsC-like HAD superfamily phosphatase